VIEEAAMAEPYVYMNGGQRGLQVRLSPQDAKDVLKAISASVVAEA
jgi:Cys-tRNA(Pro)/Cys-tRNA(Cys) deacylase